MWNTNELDLRDEGRQERFSFRTCFFIITPLPLFHLKMISKFIDYHNNFWDSLSSSIIYHDGRRSGCECVLHAQWVCVLSWVFHLCVSGSWTACWWGSGRRAGSSTRIWTTTLGSSQETWSARCRRTEATATLTFLLPLSWYWVTHDDDDDATCGTNGTQLTNITCVWKCSSIFTSLCFYKISTSHCETIFSSCF